MPPTTYSTIKIGLMSANWQTFNGTPIDLLDGTKYQLAGDGWAPGVAKHNPLSLGGYEPVTETFIVNIIGATRQEVFDNLEALANVLDTARRYSAGEPLSSYEFGIGIAVQPIGSNLSGPCWDTVIDGTVELPNDYLDQLLNNAIDGVRVTIRRLGVWLQFGENLTTANTAIAVPRQVTWTGTPPRHSRITKIDVVNVQRDTSISYKLGTLIVSEKQPLFFGTLTGAPYNNCTEAAGAAARSGNVVTLNSPSGDIRWDTTTTITDQKIAVFGSFKNITGAPQLELRWIDLQLAVGRTLKFTPITGKVMCIGVMDYNPAFHQIQLRNVSPGASSVTFDYLCVVPLDSRHARIVEFNDSFLAEAMWSRSVLHNLTIKPNALMSPIVKLRSTNYAAIFPGTPDFFIEYNIPILGDMLFTSPASLWLTLLAQGTDNWRPVVNPSAGGGVQQPPYSLTLHHGRLILE